MIRKRNFYLQLSRVADPKLLISDPDPDPTWRVISDPDPDPARGFFRIRILVCEIFVKFFAFKVGMYIYFKGHFCAEIEVFILKKVFLSLHLSFKMPNPQR